ncbi:hypothetical protein [Enterococcus sp. CWB-B31]|uniref:hypothetical protein n=1 Tax=Enterococcus sp. CWB-B31 TaxID=2885159 RepID=UPI001E615775|nr:hypothetical protein [Enterococcus sp. CWB-B31]MCB5953669.1 hypothetical protein [Enterococcus sp. CWB-B31]
MDLQKNAACSSAEIIQNYLMMGDQGVYYSDELKRLAPAIGFLQSADQTMIYINNQEDAPAVG